MFCAELAAINRARNFDESRERVAADGLRRTEQFDDLRGDAPSCVSGQLKCLGMNVAPFRPPLKLPPPLLFYPFDVVPVAPLSLAVDDVDDD